MKILEFSDFHIDYLTFNIEYDPDGIDALVFAGDLCNGFVPLYFRKLRDIAAKFPICFYVIGNHEFYGEDITRLPAKIKEFFKGSNVIVLDNNVHEYMGQRFVGSTLWSKLNPMNEYYILQNVNDFKKIRNNNSRFTTGFHNLLFEMNQQWLKENVKENDIVITHHSPSYYTQNPIYAGSVLSSLFMNNMDEFILDAKPKLWIYGHTHQTSEHIIGDTRLICNAVGYGVQQAGIFEGFKLIEI